MTTYWVAPSGSDANPGTETKPFKTFAKAIPLLKSGDVLTVRGGDYFGNVATTARAPGGIVRAAMGERPIIHGTVRVARADGWLFSGINVTWLTGNSRSSWMVHLQDGTGWRWTKSELWGARSTAAIGVSSGAKYRIDHNYIHDTYKSNDVNQDHLIYIQSSPTSGGLVDHNTIVRSPNGRGIKVGTDGGARVGGVRIEYNTLVDNFGPTNIQLSYGATNVSMVRNLLVGASAGYANIWPYQLAGTNNVARENLGWRSTGTLRTASGLSDGGGNVHYDPRLDATYRPQTLSAKAFGRYA